MRAFALASAMCALLAVSTADAHGPQIQITSDNNKIVTRELYLDGPYSTALSAPKSVYVMPVLEFDSVWYSRPNNTPSATIPGAPEFFSGPGLAYGYDLADGGPQAFVAGSVLSVSFVDGLKLWNGAAFGDAGVTQLKAFRGSNVNITSPPENFAITSDSGPFDSLNLPTVAAGYGSDGPEVHATVRYALLGDGSSPTSDGPSGIYLVTLQTATTQAGLSTSDPYYFVLSKNAPADNLNAAVASLGVDASRVQYLGIPEPATSALCVTGLALLVTRRRRTTR